MSRIADGAVALAAVRSDIRGARRQLMLAQVRHENDFGYAYPFDQTPDGSPSHNWGAIYAKGDRGTFSSDVLVDTDDGKTFHPMAAWNSSAEVGARQFANLIQYNYPLAWEAAARGDSWGYAKGLFRDGHGYYGGFPPGHKWSLAPKGTKLHSPLDHYYRILAYAKSVDSLSGQVASALGEKKLTFLKVPAPPKGGVVSGSRSSGGALGAAVIVLGGGWLITRGLGGR